MIFFQFCKHARESFRRRALEEVDPFCYRDRESSSIGNSRCNDPKKKSWLESTCNAILRKDLEVLELDPGDRCFSEDDLVVLCDAMKGSQVVKRLVLRNVETEREGHPLPILHMLRDANSIQAVRLEDSGEEALNEVAQALTQSDARVEALHLTGNVVCPRGARAIGEVLKHCRHLTEFQFCNKSITVESFSYIAQGLGGNHTIRTLDFLGSSIDDEAIAHISEALVHNNSVEFLCLDFNNFQISGIQSIAAMLSRNRRLKELHLFGNRIDSHGAACLAEAIRDNFTLESLVLSFNQIGDEGIVAMGKALTKNSTLKKFWFPSNYIGREGLVAFGKLLPDMKGIEDINVGTVFDNIGANALIEGLKYNTSLIKISIESPIPEEQDLMEEKMNFLLRLNRSGRSLFHTAQGIPSAVWAEALQKANENKSDTGAPDVMYYFLREMPELFEFWRHELVQ